MAVFSPPPQNMSKFWRIFALRTQKFFWWNKSNFVEVKKIFFDGKPKMTKKNATEFLKIRKNVKNRVFLAFFEKHWLVVFI